MPENKSGRAMMAIAGKSEEGKEQVVEKRSRNIGTRRDGMIA